MTRQWLLLLGSNQQTDSLIREAVLHLRALGAVVELTELRRFAAYSGGDRNYFNALVALTSELSRSDLFAATKRIETALGRRQDSQGTVAIDLDVLGFRHDDGWVEDPRAIEKHEFERAPTVDLLREARITMVSKKGENS